MSTLKRAIAHRYEIDVPVLYRLRGEPDWRPGRTVNASRTGVLFHSDSGAVDSGTAMELQLELPTATRTIKVRCTGSVVRCERPEDGRFHIAATIDTYDFGTEAPLPRHPSFPVA